MHTVTLGLRNLTLMAEGDAGPSDGPVLQDSAVAGNVHVGDVVHQYHEAAPTASAVASLTPVSTPADTHPGALQQVRHPGDVQVDRLAADVQPKPRGQRAGASL